MLSIIYSLWEKYCIIDIVFIWGTYSVIEVYFYKYQSLYINNNTIYFLYVLCNCIKKVTILTLVILL